MSGNISVAHEYYDRNGHERMTPGAVGPAETAADAVRQPLYSRSRDRLVVATRQTTEDRSCIDLVGLMRRFGQDGVFYEIIEVVSSREARIRVLETGEIATYPTAAIFNDPRS